MSNTNPELDLLTILGLDMTLKEYQKKVLDGHAPYYETEPLKFACTQCGKCCTRPGLVYLTDDDIGRIATFFGMTAEEIKVSMLERSGSDWVIQVDEEADCLFFHNDQCRIHTIKPSQCKTYPFWPELVSDRSAWRRERRYCPGIGEGRDYNTAQVRRLLLGLDATQE